MPSLLHKYIGRYLDAAKKLEGYLPNTYDEAGQLLTTNAYEVPIALVGLSVGLFGFRMFKGGLFYGVGHAKESGSVGSAFIARFRNTLKVNPYIAKSATPAPMRA